MDTGRFIGERFLRKLFSSVNSYTEPYVCFNTLRPRQNGRHFSDDMFKCIFLNENIWIPIEISLKFVPKGSINNNPALFQIMAWRRPGDKPLSEPMMVSSLTHICVTRPLGDVTVYFKEYSPNTLEVIFMSTSCDIYLSWMAENTFDDLSWLVEVMACCLHAKCHYLSQCWPRSKWPYGVTRPEWLKISMAILIDFTSETFFID